MSSTLVSDPHAGPTFLSALCSPFGVHNPNVMGYVGLLSATELLVSSFSPQKANTVGNRKSLES